MARIGGDMRTAGRSTSYDGESRARTDEVLAALRGESYEEDRNLDDGADRGDDEV